uniref:Bactericidal permeability-increasing protein n=1 Tax=Maylandia zebra TaxID=106582 RepID=A0A3P9DEA4_9CICH
TKCATGRMFLCCWLVLGALFPATLSINPGVKVRLTEKGIEYGKVCVKAQKLNSIQVPDFSGEQRVSPIGKVQYNLSNIHVLKVGIPKSSVDLVPGTGVRMSIGDAFISLNGNWRVKYLRIM